MRYLLGSGFHSKPGDGRIEFLPVWRANVDKYAFPPPCGIKVICTGGQSVQIAMEEAIILSGDLGHFMDLINKKKDFAFNGWMATVLTLAMIAYCDTADFIYLEQDALAFGPWVQKLYSEDEKIGVLFGRKHLSEPWMPCSQSLFLVRHWYIPEFVRLILGEGPQNIDGNLGEHIFARLEERYPDKWKQFGWGVDRERPIPYDDEVFYCQQIKPEELATLKEKGLL